MSFSGLQQLADDLASRDAQQLRRRRRVLQSAQGPRVDADNASLLHFGSNDYLGLASDPRLIAAVRQAALRWGVGAGASHLVSGHFAPHDALEQELASWVASCADARALLFSSGYLANLAILTTLAAHGDAVFADKTNHACLNDGAILSRADFLRYPHQDLSRLEERLAGSRARRRVICTDAVFSMDGDIAAIPALLGLTEKYDAWLVVDDAHGFGVLGEGRGTLAHFGIASERIVYMGTLGKAAGVAGAFVVAHPIVIETLIQRARSYVFTTGAPPLLAAALLESLAVVRAEPQRRAHLFALVRRWRDAALDLPWRVLESATPIQPVVIGSAAEALRVSDALWRRGVWVPAIRPPTVPQDTARLRITLSAAHTEGDVDALVDALHAVAAQ